MGDRKDELNFKYGILIEEFEPKKPLPSNFVRVKTLKTPTVPTIPAKYAAVELVELPDNFTLDPETRFATIVPAPSHLSLPGRVALVEKAVLRSLPEDFTIVDTGGVLDDARRNLGIRVPIIPPNIKLKK